jgi:hypothetical protein
MTCVPDGMADLVKIQVVCLSFVYFFAHMLYFYKTYQKTEHITVIKSMSIYNNYSF